MRKAARSIVEKLRLCGHEAYFAGGWVRDYLLRREPRDIDIATSAFPDQVLQLFPGSRMIGAQFGVVQIPLEEHAFEVATFRSDNEYRDGRHPSSVTFSGPEQDARRRDFTVNGLFYDPLNDRVLDYVGGREDLDARQIRTIGNPEARFSEDKLRMLRAIRLSCTLDFAIVPETWSAIRNLSSAILQVSWERIRDELMQIIAGPAPSKGLFLLHDSGILGHILPEVEALHGIPRSLDTGRKGDLLAHTGSALDLLQNPSAALAFGVLLHDVGKPGAIAARDPESLRKHGEIGKEIADTVCRRLRMSNGEVQRVSALVAIHSRFGEAPDLRESELKRLLRRPDIADQLELHRVDRLSAGKDLSSYDFCLQKLEEYGERTRPALLLNGEDLIEMGYSPGPVFRDILRNIEDLQLEEILYTREDAIKYVKANFPLPIT